MPIGNRKHFVLSRHADPKMLNAKQLGYLREDLGFYAKTAAEWASENPVLGLGEQGYESDTGKLKIGDGSTAWTSFGYTIDGSIQTVADKAERNALTGILVGTLVKQADIPNIVWRLVDTDPSLDASWEGYIYTTNQDGSIVVDMTLSDFSGIIPESNQLGQVDGVPSIGDGSTEGGRKLQMTPVEVEDNQAKLKLTNIAKHQTVRITGEADRLEIFLGSDSYDPYTIASFDASGGTFTGGGAGETLDGKTFTRTLVSGEVRYSHNNKYAPEDPYVEDLTAAWEEERLGSGFYVIINPDGFWQIDDYLWSAQAQFISNESALTTPIDQCTWTATNDGDVAPSFSNVQYRYALTDRNWLTLTNTFALRLIANRTNVGDEIMNGVTISSSSSSTNLGWVNEHKVLRLLAPSGGVYSFQSCKTSLGDGITTIEKTIDHTNLNSDNDPTERFTLPSECVPRGFVELTIAKTS